MVGISSVIGVVFSRIVPQPAVQDCGGGAVLHQPPPGGPHHQNRRRPHNQPQVTEVRKENYEIFFIYSFFTLLQKFNFFHLSLREKQYL